MVHKILTLELSNVSDADLQTAVQEIVPLLLQLEKDINAKGKLKACFTYQSDVQLVTDELKFTKVK